MTDYELLTAAQSARQNAYAPYSGFSVGAALLTADGRVYLGSNVENSAFGAGSCAERSALFAAVSAGARDFAAIAVAGGPRVDENCTEVCTPCGVCRQALYEFAPELRVLLGDPANPTVYALSELLAHGFRL